MVDSKKQADNTKFVKGIVQCEQRPDDLGSGDELVSRVHARTLREVGVPRKRPMRTRS